MIPLHSEVEAELDLTASPITNVTVRYSTQTTTTTGIGTDAKTFQVLNDGDVLCEKSSLCSPDGKWKAASGTAELDRRGRERVSQRASFMHRRPVSVY